MSVKQNVAHYLLVSTQQHVPRFLFDLASNVVPGSEFEILSHEEKFRRSLEKRKVRFDSKYKTLQLLCFWNNFPAGFSLKIIIVERYMSLARYFRFKN